MKHAIFINYNYRYFYGSSIQMVIKYYYKNTFVSFENNTRKIYSFINSLTKTESVIFPTLIKYYIIIFYLYSG